MSIIKMSCGRPPTSEELEQQRQRSDLFKKRSDIIHIQCYVNHDKYFAYLLRTGEYSPHDIRVKGWKICCPSCDGLVNNNELLNQFLLPDKGRNILFAELPNVGILRNRSFP